MVNNNNYFNNNGCFDISYPTIGQVVLRKMMYSTFPKQDKCAYTSAIIVPTVLAYQVDMKTLGSDLFTLHTPTVIRISFVR